MSDDEKLGLEDLSPPPGAKQSSRRVGRGRGSGKGKTSGRGHKGQKSRSGDKVPAWFEGGQMPLYRRLPKRGFNPRNRTEYEVVNLDVLEERVPETEIDPGVLRDHGLVRPGSQPVKILGRGDVDRALTVRAHAFSSSAEEKITAAGGTVERIE